MSWWPVGRRSTFGSRCSGARAGAPVIHIVGATRPAYVAALDERMGHDDFLLEASQAWVCSARAEQAWLLCLEVRARLPRRAARALLGVGAPFAGAASGAGSSRGYDAVASGPSPAWRPRRRSKSGLRAPGRDELRARVVGGWVRALLRDLEPLADGPDATDDAGEALAVASARSPRPQTGERLGRCGLAPVPPTSCQMRALLRDVAAMWGGDTWHGRGRDKGGGRAVADCEEDGRAG